MPKKKKKNNASYFPSARRTLYKAFVTDVSGAKENISIIFNMVSKVLKYIQSIGINYSIVIFNIKILVFNNKQPQLSVLSSVYVMYRMYTNTVPNDLKISRPDTQCDMYDTGRCGAPHLTLHRLHLFVHVVTFNTITKTKLRGFIPRANHTDRAAAAGRRS